MSYLSSTIHIQRRKAFDYINNIVYPKVNYIIQKEYFGIKQDCKYNHLNNYYLLVELLTQISKEINCLFENNVCVTFDTIKKIYDRYKLKCVISCFPCHNLPYKPLLDIFDINFRYLSDSENYYLIRYIIRIWNQSGIESEIVQLLGLKGEDYNLDIINPNPDDLEIRSILLNGEYIPITNLLTFENLSCIQEVIVNYRYIPCKDAEPILPVITLTDSTQTTMSFSWTSSGTNVTYLFEILLNGNVIQSHTLTDTNITIVGLLPSTNYTVRITATNCNGVVRTNELPVQTTPYLVIVQVINGTSTETGTHQVNFNDNFLVNFTSVNPFVLTSFKINGVVINTLNITGTVNGLPQTGNYNILNINENKFVEIVYSPFDFCAHVNMTYLSNTITIQ